MRFINLQKVKCIEELGKMIYKSLENWVQKEEKSIKINNRGF